MKKLLLAFSIISLGFGTITEIQANAKNQNEEAPCICYCAFEPGPRSKSPGNKPFVRTFTNSIGQTFKVCLCDQRDLDRLNDEPELIDKITEGQLLKVNCCEKLLNKKTEE
ncbi:MAG: hypothetical protein WD055_03045 [Candidatus Dependentiae bacterium]